MNNETKIVHIDSKVCIHHWIIDIRNFGICRKCGAGLLATVHCPSRLPVLWQTEPNLETAHRLVRHLLADTPSLVLDETDVVQAYHRHNGNIREILFNLYDVYERRVAALNGSAEAASRQP